jgi:excisionase family DNA binding protein
VDKKLLRPVEAAMLMGVSRSTIYIMLTRDDLPSISIGKARRIPAAALDDYIQAQLAQRREAPKQSVKPPATRPDPQTSRLTRKVRQ